LVFFVNTMLRRILRNHSHLTLLFLNHRRTNFGRFANPAMQLQILRCDAVANEKQLYFE
jgi:hypothetical protein